VADGKEVATDFTDYTDRTAPGKEFPSSESVQSVKSVATFPLTAAVGQSRKEVRNG